ncbi:MAG: lamin tail domain-containing protein [Flavobacteriaceae bacterium]|nr:lamin tail domain-containing protein [Flavobacteriaceae bacterium]
MKQFYFLLFSLFAFNLSFAQVTELYFSKYAEGSSNNKFIEIYNGTDQSIDLSNYAFPNVSNAPSVPGEYEYWNTFTEGASIAAGDVYVIAHGSANQTILDAADQTYNYLSNGDDGFALVSGGTHDDIDSDGSVDAGEMSGYTIIDWLGDWNGDPGSGWEVAGISNGTKDHTLIRKSSVCGPNEDWTASAGTTVEDSEWIVGDIDTGWDALGSYSGCVSGPALTVTSPSNNQEFASGTTSVTLSVTVDNFVVDQTPANGGSGDGHIHWTLDGNSQAMKYDTLDETIDVVDGGSHTVTMFLVDNNHQAISPEVSQTVSFSIAFPCDLQIGTITETCDANTSGVDTYTTTFDFTGGGTSQYTISTTNNVGTIGGDDPSSVESGTITISGVSEGTNYTVNFLGDSSNSSCDFNKPITSPSCSGSVTCANVGDVIFTEIMQNPSAVLDTNGEYVEIYNTTNSTIDLEGWVIKDDVTTTEAHTITNLTIPANGYAVLGNNSNSSTNGGYTNNHQFNGVYLGNSTDGIILECSGTVIDQVIWDDGATFPEPNGKSMELKTNKYTSTDNDDGANWYEASASFGDGDSGTPGAQNSLSVISITNNYFEMYPNPTNSGFVTIKSNQMGAVQAQVFDLLGKEVINTAVNNERMDVSNLNAGVYVVKLTQNKNTTTKKLIIQ